MLTNLQCVLTEEENERGAKHPGDFSLATKENIHKLALKRNFFGLYHFSDTRNAPLPILQGVLQAKNFVLFKQLLENCKSLS